MDHEGEGSGVQVRTVVGDELATWFDVVAKAFGQARADDAHSRAERLVLPEDRATGAFAPGGGMVGATGAYGFGLVVPGGATVPAAGVTDVAVLATHRRRGVLRAMMAHQLDDAAARGEAVAVLNATEATIYGRFGYGMASRYAVWQLDPRATAFASPAPVRAVRFVPQDEAAAVVAPLYDASLGARPGQVARPPAWWDLLLGQTETWKGGGQFFVAVVDPDPDGPDGPEPGGYALYSLAEGGPGGRFRLVLRELVSASDETAAALWRFCLDVDLVTEVVAEVAVDEPLLWRLADSRAARSREVRDYLFVRVLDVEASLAARRWAAPVDLVLEVADGFRPQVAGRYRVRGDRTTSSCEHTDAPADLALDVADLGSLLLGGFAPSALAAGGRVRECRPGALARADAAFPWAPAPFCATRF
jgi:predicted acetyltransferase